MLIILLRKKPFNKVKILKALKREKVKIFAFNEERSWISITAASSEVSLSTVLIDRAYTM